MQLKSIFITICCTAIVGVSSTLSVLSGCASHPTLPVVDPKPEEKDGQNRGVENLQRSIKIIDNAIAHYFDPQTFEMRRFYNPFTGTKSEERASVWMYTSAIESVNAVLSGLRHAKDIEGNNLYENHYGRYVQLLDDLYANADYYLGTFQLVSFTQTKEWSVYAVDRVNQKGQANVTGVLNVYDDQMWLIRELLDSYKLTGKTEYLAKAEYLTAYVLDGWDATRDENGKENGGIPWGPGYTTKHACSNGPLISSLVWLHELYKGKTDQIEHRYIDENDRKTRRTQQVGKQQYYLDYARAIYDWQKSNLLNKNGVYTDMMGGCVPNCDVRYEQIDGIRYKANTPLTEAVGEAFTYNSGTMLSGAVDLFRVTDEAHYAADAQALAKNSFSSFAALGKDVPQYYSFGTDGFKNWFNGILMRGYHDAVVLDGQADAYLNAFQRNLDYGFERFNKDGFLPSNLLTGWGNEKDGQGVEGMFMFAYAAQYALLGQYHLESN